MWHASLGVACEAESDSFLNPQSDVVYWFKIWVGTSQKVVGSDPWAFCAWLLTLFCSKRTVPIISRVINYFWIKVSAKWLLTHSHKLLGCLILLQQCVLVVMLFLVRRWGVRADSLLKVWTAILLSPFATSLFPVCHQLPSCLHYFSVMSVGLSWVSVSFLEMTVHRQATRQRVPLLRHAGLSWGVAHALCLHCSRVILQVSLWDLCVLPTFVCV